MNSPHGARTGSDLETVERTGDLVRLAFELVRRVRRHYEVRVAETGLTPNEARVLLELPTDEPRPIGAVAVACHVDHPNATRLVARLTARGLVHRPVNPGDRRVKGVALTTEGRTLRRHLEKRITVDNPVLSGLTADQQDVLHELLRLVVQP